MPWKIVPTTIPSGSLCEVVIRGMTGKFVPWSGLQGKDIDGSRLLVDM